MAATEDSGLSHGTNGSPQGNLEEQTYPAQEEINESENGDSVPPKYIPSPKHEPGHGWGSDNPIKSEEGQKLLDSGVHNGRQVFNVTDDGKLVKFQPDHTPENGYHAYEVTKPRDIPSSVLKNFLNSGKISRAEYTKFRKGKK